MSLSHLAEITVLARHGAVAGVERGIDIPAASDSDAQRKDGVQSGIESLDGNAAVIELSMGYLTVCMNPAVRPAASDHNHVAVSHKLLNRSLQGIRGTVEERKDGR